MILMSIYQKIQKCKKQGFSKSEVSHSLHLDPKTVIKYYEMKEKDYLNYCNSLKYREKVFAPYKEDILSIYKFHNYQKLPVSSIYDYLEENYEKLPGSEQSLRNYIQYLIESNYHFA